MMSEKTIEMSSVEKMTTSEIHCNWSRKTMILENRFNFSDKYIATVICTVSVLTSAPLYHFVKVNTTFSYTVTD